MTGRNLWRTALAAGILISLAVLALGVCAALPASSRLTMAASSRWPVLAPRTVLAALAAAVLAIAGLLRGPRRFSAVAAAAAGLAVAVSAAMTASIVLAVSAAGGSANPVRALLPAGSNAIPDAYETYQPGLSAAVYRPHRSTRAPVIVYAHGGGWFAGGATDLGHDMRWFADRGWLVVSVGYRLATDAHPTWDEADRDVACALVWTHANAGRWGGDTDRLILAGDSAGGNLAVNVAYAAALGRARSSCAGTIPVPMAVIVQYPVVDPQDAYDNGYPARGAEPKVFIERYIGGPPQRYPERMRAISSGTYLSPSAPPTLIVEPARDGLIPTGGVLRFAQRARSAGVQVTLVRIPFANHAYDQIAAGSLGNQASLSIRCGYLVSHGLGP